MTTYTFSRARQKLAGLLTQAAGEGEVLIRRQDGSVFSVRPVRSAESPLDVAVVPLGVTTREIVGIVRESRERRSA